MPREVNLEKFNDYTLLVATTALNSEKCAKILQVGTSTLSRWRKDTEYKAKLKLMEKKSDKEVLATKLKLKKLKLKYAIRLILTNASLREIKELCRAFENKALPDPGSDSYKQIASTARIVDMDIMELFNAISARAAKVSRKSNLT